MFLDLVTVPDGRANSIVAAIKGCSRKINIPRYELFGLRTDGTAVMTGMNTTTKNLFTYVSSY